MKILLKIGLVLAAVLMLCLFPMPYGYYTLIRFSAMIIFGCMAYCFYKDEKIPLGVVAGSLALLFQPFYKIVLGRMIWNIVDVAAAVLLVLLWYKNKK